MSGLYSIWVPECEKRSPKVDIHVQTPAGFNAGNYVVRKPAYEVLAQTPVKNRQGLPL
jgi:hypothetical protein